MIRMILADDEPIITRGIQKLVDWSSLGVQVVGEYQDGKAALDGIITEKPDIALLDIYMPKMTGIDILKEINTLGLKTRVIFISGFQDFQYAKDALRYGASDYLLKPIVRDELMNAIECCLDELQREKGINQEQVLDVEETSPRMAYDKLVEMEETTYLPVLLEIPWQENESKQEWKLIQFYVISFVEAYLEERSKGIVFSKNKSIVLVLTGMQRAEAREFLYEMLDCIKSESGHEVGAIIGDAVNSMGQIPDGYTRCRELRGYFFFADQIATPILMTGEPVFHRQISTKEYEDCRQLMLESIVAQDQTAYEKYCQKFFSLVCIRSDGRKEDACYHFCTTIRMAEERITALGLRGLEYDVGYLLEQGRATINFRQMKEFYGSYLEKYLRQIKESVLSNEKKDILHAKNYIENHYKENLTLEVLAREIHMNPYYFSNFFKKQSGENFKDYVNKVRLQHALSLLVSTDMKIYEIATEVGFHDARSLTELFQRAYGETPASYRKRVKFEIEDENE